MQRNECDLEERIMEITQSGQQTERQVKKKKKSNIRDLWDDKKWGNLHTIGIPEGGKKRGLNIYLKKLWLKTSKSKGY